MKVGSVGLLVVAHAAADINQGAIPALIPFFIAEHHISYAAAAAAVFIVNLVSTIAQPAFGYIADRRSMPWMIPVSMLAIGCGVSFTGIAPSYRVGLAGLVVSGLGIAMFHPEGARLMNYLAGDKKATAMSLFGIGGQLGFAFGPLIATALLLALGLKGTIYLIIPGAVMAALVMVKLPGLSAGYGIKKGHHGSPTQSKGRDLWPAFSLLSGCPALPLRYFLWTEYVSSPFSDQCAPPVESSGRLGAGSHAGSMVAGNFLGGTSADRIGYRMVTITGFALLSVLLPILAFIDNATWAILLLVPIGAVLSLPFGPMVVMGQSYLPNRVGLASGITLGLAFSFGGLVTPILGAIGDHYGLRTTIAVVAFLPIVCTALSLALPRVDHQAGH